MAKFGVVGLDTMGVGLCANAIQKGHEVVGFNRTGGKTQTAAKYLSDKYSIVKEFTPAMSAEEFMKNLAGDDPPIVMMLVKNGEPTWDMFRHLSVYMPDGTIVLDMANEKPADTARFEEMARQRHVRWLGTGISGGRKGAEGLNEHGGPAIMAGGDEATYKIVEPILMDLSAKADYGPCCGWFGPGMAGHRVKNVHNGIEYDFMMCMAEVYAMLRAGRMEPEEIAGYFKGWIKDIPELQGYLMDIAIKGMGVKAEDGSPLVLDVLDEAKAKGTGKFTSQIAMDEGIPIASIDMAVLARCLSAFRSDRAALAKTEPPTVDLSAGKDELCKKLGDALFCNMIMSYDHGLMLLWATEEEHGYKIDRAKAAEVWRGGCIINSHLLPAIRDAYQAKEDLFTLMSDAFFKEQLDRRQQNWREAVSTMMLAGIPCLASCGNLGAYDSLRTAKLDAASFNQMLRDTFGDHTFRRFSIDGTWTCDWDGDGTITRLK